MLGSIGLLMKSIIDSSLRLIKKALAVFLCSISFITHFLEKLVWQLTYNKKKL